MITQVPRLRMFAGPNGSGKSTLKTILRPELFGIYINIMSLQKILQLIFREYVIASAREDILYQKIR